MFAIRIRTTPLLLLIVLALPVTLVPSPASAARARPTVSNGTLMADNGALLRGVFYDPDVTGAAGDPGLPTVLLMKDYGFNTLHLYGERPCSSSGPSVNVNTAGYNLSRIQKYVDWTRDNDLYLVLTIGQHCNSSRTPIGGGTDEIVTYNAAFTDAFWKVYAPLYKNETHVIYEILNEPWWEQTGSAVEAQGYPSALLDLEADQWTKVRAAAPNAPILLFSYGGFTDAAGAKADWNAVEARVTGSLDNKTAMAFHTYGSGNVNTIRNVVRAARDTHGLSIINTEVERNNVFDAMGNLLYGYLRADQTELWELDEISWLSFMKLGQLVSGKEIGDLRLVSHWKDRVVDIVDAGTNGNAIIWIPDDPTADWPVERASDLCGDVIALKSVSDGKYVSVGGDSLLRANSSTKSVSTRFTVFCNSSKQVWLKAQQNNLYANPRWNSTTDPYIANAPFQGTNNRLELLRRLDGKLLIRSNFNGSARPSWRITKVDNTSKKLFDNQTLFISRARFVEEVIP